MGYFLTAVVAFLAGVLIMAGTSYWYLKELSVLFQILIARLERLNASKSEILDAVEHKRWWETLLGDIDNTKENIITEMSKVL